MYKLVLISLLIILSCTKEEHKKRPSDEKLTENELTQISQAGNLIFISIQDILFSVKSEASKIGYYLYPPDMIMKKSTKDFISIPQEGEWVGPDADGLYLKIWDSYGLRHTEKIQYSDTIKYEYLVEESADYNASNLQEISFIRDENGSFSGTFLWVISSDYYGILNNEWMVTFNQWNPASGAGSFDWYWRYGYWEEVLKHYIHISASVVSNELFISASQNNEYGIWNFDYHSPLYSVTIPELP
ncbi:MAG: hypothetical protein HC906_02070 [Bacteroidales bacterium]|nr:hypothetical protein [Bacteroidales bacterium]